MITCEYIRIHARAEYTTCVPSVATTSVMNEKTDFGRLIPLFIDWRAASLTAGPKGRQRRHMSAKRVPENDPDSCRHSVSSYGP